MSLPIKNKVRLIDGSFLEVVCAGPQNSETISRLVDECSELVLQLQHAGLPVLALVRLQGIGRVDVNARRAAARALRKLQYDKVALYGASRFVEKMADLVIRAVDKEEKIRIFADRHSAVDWLQDALVTAQVDKRRDAESAYRAYVEHKLEQLNDFISLAVIGEYSKDIPMPKEEDEFTDTFVGVRLLIETLEEKAKRLAQTTGEGR